MRFDRNPTTEKGPPYLDRSWPAHRDGSTRGRPSRRRRRISRIRAVLPGNVRLLGRCRTSPSDRGYEMQSRSSNWISIPDRSPSTTPESARRSRMRSIASSHRNVWFGSAGRDRTDQLELQGTGIYTNDGRNYNVPNGVDMANNILDDAGYARGAACALRNRARRSPYGEEWRGRGVRAAATRQARHQGNAALRRRADMCAASTLITITS